MMVILSWEPAQKVSFLTDAQSAYHHAAAVPRTPRFGFFSVQRGTSSRRPLPLRLSRRERPQPQVDFVRRAGGRRLCEFETRLRPSPGGARADLEDRVRTRPQRGTSSQIEGGGHLRGERLLQFREILGGSRNTRGPVEGLFGRREASPAGAYSRLRRFRPPPEGRRGDRPERPAAREQAVKLA